MLVLGEAGARRLFPIALVRSTQRRAASGHSHDQGLDGQTRQPSKRPPELVPYCCWRRNGDVPDVAAPLETPINESCRFVFQPGQFPHPAASVPEFVQ
jgi:hypothetical protein